MQLAVAFLASRALLAAVDHGWLLHHLRATSARQATQPMATLRTQTNSAAVNCTNSACFMTAQVSLVVALLAPLRPPTPPSPDRRGVRLFGDAGDDQ